MPSLTITSIDLKTFNETLSRYPSTIPNKLRDLDAQRYDTIPHALAQRDVPFLTKEEVEKLVEWKLYVLLLCISQNVSVRNLRG
jgi:hypothetical protein